MMMIPSCHPDGNELFWFRSSDTSTYAERFQVSGGLSLFLRLFMVFMVTAAVMLAPELVPF
ncbi:MAG: hypothetical protein IMW97_08185 [Firmicutes bacterium]|nr:hypothetical protein [Candidatus Fermentithermobacillaceae bacterium]